MTVRVKYSLVHTSSMAPNAETISDRIVSLPLFPAMTDADQDRAIKAMADLFGRKEP